jgi:hypothetical protein
MSGTSSYNDYARLRGLRWACVLLPLLSTAACRTSDVSEEVELPTEAVATVEPEAVAAKKPETIAAAQQAQTYGKGAARVILLLHLSGDLADANRNKSLINGARLAVADLGPNDLTLIVEDTRSSAEAIAAAISGAGNAQLVIVPGEDEAIASAVARIAKGQTPVVALGHYEEAMTPGSYWFLPSWIDEIAQAAGYASRTFKKKLHIAILEPQGMDRRLTQMLTKKLVKTAEKVETVRYSTETGAAGISAAGRKALDIADAVIVMERDIAVAPFLDQLRKMEFSNGQKFFVVRGDAARQLSFDPAFAGAIAAVPDFGNFEIVANRYREVYAGTMPVEAAYTYDAVAVAAGIVRANRGPIIARPVLESKSGFNGATGSFRFHTDGQVERNYNIVRLAKDDLVVLEAASTEF